MFGMCSGAVARVALSPALARASWLVEAHDRKGVLREFRLCGSLKRAFSVRAVFLTRQASATVTLLRGEA